MVFRELVPRGGREYAHCRKEVWKCSNERKCHIQKHGKLRHLYEERSARVSGAIFCDIDKKRWIDRGQNTYVYILTPYVHTCSTCSIQN